MKTTKTFALTIVMLLLSTFAFAQEHPAHDQLQDPRHEQAGDSTHPAKNVLEAAKQAGGFATFLKIVDAAGVTERFEGKGPYTVFAPTDEAFARLPEGMLDDLLQPANQAQLAGLLANHVVPGRLTSDRIESMKVANVNGQDLHIRAIGGVITVNGSRVLRPDLMADNGVLHGIKLVIRTTEPVKRPDRKPLDHPAH